MQETNTDFPVVSSKIRFWLIFGILTLIAVNAVSFGVYYFFFRDKNEIQMIFTASTATVKSEGKYLDNSSEDNKLEEATST